MSKPSSSSSSLRPVSWAGMAAASAAVFGSVFLTSPVGAQVLGGYGQRPNGPNSSQTQPYTPSWAGPQLTPSWAGPQPKPSWAGPQQAPSWASPQTPSWAQTPMPGYRRQSPVITPAPVTNSPVFTRPTSPLTPTTDQATSDRSGMPGTNYKRRNSVVGAGSGSGYPLQGNVVQNSVAPVTGSTPPSYRITTPIGQRRLPARDYNNFVYNAPVTYVGGPTLLGGYYYGNYCDVRYDSNCYPSVFSAYYGMPQFIYNPGIIIVSEPYYPVYTTTYLPFYVPVYQTTYNENNYYVGSEDRVQELQQGGAPAQEALKNAYPADSFQAAFADIEKAWQNNDITLIDRHLRDKDTKLSVFVDAKYSYSLASGDFLQITRDAFDRLKTVSFTFTRLRKAKNGDVTAFGKHVYRTADGSAADNARVGDTVPFSTDGSQPNDKTDASAAGAEKTIYVSYTLTHHDTGWYIIAVDSSPNDLVK